MGAFTMAGGYRKFTDWTKRDWSMRVEFDIRL